MLKMKPNGASSKMHEKICPRSEFIHNGKYIII